MPARSFSQAAPREIVSLTREPIHPASLLEAVGDPTAGGNVLFVGSARGVTDGVVTTRLVYDAHEPLAQAVLADLVRVTREKFALVACGVAHRLGTVAAGEASVAVAASAPHRKAAFAAAEWLMEQIKRDVPIWKCEHRSDGGRDWVHGDTVSHE